MSDFNIAVQKTLVHEGGFVDDPVDPGGATKYGITQADMPGVSIKDITPEQATAYYSERYWKPLYSQITSQDIADKIFDMGVLFGVGEAILLLQHVLKTGFPEIEPDGIFGPSTLGAVEQADDTSLLNAYKSALVAHALQIVVKKPEEKKFVAGWGTRINS